MIHIEKKILHTVRETISAHRMFKQGDAVLVAVSGGPDSIALVHIIFTLAVEFSLRPAIAHLNHCLRGSDSDRDAEFVADTARQLGAPIYSDRKDVLGFQQRSWCITCLQFKWRSTPSAMIILATRISG